MLWLALDKFLQRGLICILHDNDQLIHTLTLVNDEIANFEVQHLDDRFVLKFAHIDHLLHLLLEPLRIVGCLHFYGHFFLLIKFLLAMEYISIWARTDCFLLQQRVSFFKGLWLQVPVLLICCWDLNWRFDRHFVVHFFFIKFFNCLFGFLYSSFN